ncbi:MAG: SCO6745 family protein [Actinomycetota bacterium]
MPEARSAWEELGLAHPRMGYFGPRAAAMGKVEASVVSATFFNFNPATVARFVPEVWCVASPAEIVRTRYRVADVALRRLLGPAVESTEMTWAAEVALEASTACPPGGRPLFAAHAAVPPPEEPHLRLWHALTLLRESGVTATCMH